jgi:hypothetical protein
MFYLKKESRFGKKPDTYNNKRVSHLKRRGFVLSGVARMMQWQGATKRHSLSYRFISAYALNLAEQRREYTSCIIQFRGHFQELSRTKTKAKQAIEKCSLLNNRIKLFR